MIVFLLQSLFLIAAAFVIGAVLGSLYRKFKPKEETTSERSTRDADARIAATAILPANDDVRQSAKEAAAMIPPAEPVPPAELAATKPARKSSAKKVSAGEPEKRIKSPRQNDEHRPATLKQARRGKPDVLTDIDGIGAAIQSRLFETGIFHFDQIANWSIDEATWIGEELGFPGRVQRENWVKQAAALMPAKPATVRTPVRTKGPVKTKAQVKSGPRPSQKSGTSRTR